MTPGRVAVLITTCLASCNAGDGPDVVRIRFEASLQPGVEFNRIQLALAVDANPSPFYEAGWEVGSAALPSLPATVVVRRGSGRHLAIIADALWGTFVVDRQQATVDFVAPEEREVLLVFGPRYLCGNGRLDADEACDCGAEGTLSTTCQAPNSDATPNACRTDCQAARCGDGVTDTGEQCDDGNRASTDACTAACLPNRCGDGEPLFGVACFAEAPSSPLAPVLGSWSAKKGVAVADLDQDGDDDLITCCRDQTVGGSPMAGFDSRLGDGEGGFAAPTFWIVVPLAK